MPSCMCLLVWYWNEHWTHTLTHAQLRTWTNMVASSSLNNRIKAFSSLASFWSSFIFNFYAFSTFIYRSQSTLNSLLALVHSDANSIRFLHNARTYVDFQPSLCPPRLTLSVSFYLPLTPPPPSPPSVCRSDVFVIYQKQMEIRVFNRFLSLDETEKRKKINSVGNIRHWIVWKWIQVRSHNHSHVRNQWFQLLQ